MFKKIIFISICIAILVSTNADSIKNFGKIEVIYHDITENYAWAKPAIEELSAKGIVSEMSEGIFAPSYNVSKEQLAKMLSLGLNLPKAKTSTQTFLDVPPSRWSHPFIEASFKYFPQNTEYPINEFKPDLLCTREMLALTVAKALDLKETDHTYLYENFKDAEKVTPDTAGLLCSIIKTNIISGNNGMLNPQDNITRAEAAVILKRASDYKNGDAIIKTDEENQKTNIIGKPQISHDKAVRWAKSKNADERFIDIAKTYWEYGEKTGIRPEVLYAQAAKETNYGKYTGNVIPSQNNWAGIKTVTASGDQTFDHETFENAEDGVRGHFNHMCAYVGLAPLGEPHARYQSVKTAAWAGTISYVEDLGGKWAPDENYGKSIVNNYMLPMANS